MLDGKENTHGITTSEKKTYTVDEWGAPSKLDFYETTSVVSFFFMQLKDGVGIGQDSSILTFFLFVSHCSIL